MINTRTTQSSEGSRSLNRIVRAYRVEHKGWPDVTGIVRTHSAPRARYLTWHSANDVGYKVKFGDLRVLRAKEYDDAIGLKADQCYAVDFAESICAGRIAQTPPDSGTNKEMLCHQKNTLS